MLAVLGGVVGNYDGKVAAQNEYTERAMSLLGARRRRFCIYGLTVSRASCYAASVTTSL